jgi:LDH2 family malate/lactate/ureidoglycolate dehydrogenase
MKIPIGELRLLVEQALIKQGHGGVAVTTIADILMYAQLRGNNQGIAKLVGKGIPKRSDALSPRMVKEAPVSALWDGRKTHAMIVMDLVTDTAIAKAKKVGVGIVGNYGTADSTGALGYYVNKIARQGLVGMAYASTPLQLTAPYGSTEGLFSTNPMAYGIPTEGEPIILDMATASTTLFGLIEAKIAGKTLPEGLGFDKDGNPTQDPEKIMAGSIKPFGGHKGAGLALMVQILAGALVRADSIKAGSENWGNLVMAIDPNILTSREDFTREVTAIAKRVKSARRAEGVEEILVPGERARAFNTKVMNAGVVELENNLLSQLRMVAG